MSQGAGPVPDRHGNRFHVSRRAWLRPSLVVASLLLLVGAGAAAAFESDTVGSFWRGLWWSTSLMTTVGFIGEQPRTSLGAATSVVLMIAGFLLLALVSASFASLFVREDEEPAEQHERAADREIIARLDEISSRLDALERRDRADGGN